MNFRLGQSLPLVGFILLFLSCRKEQAANNTPPPPSEPVKKILLKDITAPHLPSPFYHFEYNPDSTVKKVNFASGFSIYDVLYKGNKISEMRNNILVNQDTLRYLYDSSGKVGLITFINNANGVYRLVSFVYNGNQVREVEWNQKVQGGYLIDRRLTLSYYTDSNVKTIIDYRPDLNGSGEINDTTLFEQYDDKINVDDFSLLHDAFHEHLFLLQGFRLQKNNPGKETFSGGVGLVSYTIDYTYSYNIDHTPSTKNGDFLYTAGADSGKRFHTNAAYTYY